MFQSFFFNSDPSRHGFRGGCGPRGREFGEGFRGERGFGGHWHEHAGKWGKGFGREGGNPWGRGGRERVFDSGELQLVILKLLAERPSYGYELIKAIEERLAGGYAPSPGVVYPTLTMLEERGFAEVISSEGNRKVYSITEAGRAELDANKARIDAIFERLEHSGARFNRERAPEIMRAFGNLGQAIRARMMRAESLTPEQLSKIAQAINDAAKAIDGV